MLKRLLAVQPVLIGQVIGAILGVAIAFGAPIDDGQKAALIGLVVVFATLFIHQSVAAPATVIAAVTDAATKTAEKLTTTTVGAAGKIIPAGEGVVTGVVGEVLNGVGGLVSSVAKGA